MDDNAGIEIPHDHGDGYYLNPCEWAAFVLTLGPEILDSFTISIGEVPAEHGRHPGVSMSVTFARSGCACQIADTTSADEDHARD